MRKMPFERTWVMIMPATSSWPPSAWGPPSEKRKASMIRNGMMNSPTHPM